MRVIVYARVSTTRQAERDLSIPDQLAHAERYCAERGHQIVASYVDPGASARDDNRPEFQRMIADIKSGLVRADLLLVHSLSRFFRDLYGSAFYSRELARYGVKVVSATQELSDDSGGALIRNVLSAFDEYASLETAKHVTRSMIENARRGFWNGSTPPFGYRTVIVERHGGKDKKKLEIEPKEAEIVRLIFQLYLYGDGKSGPLGIKDLTSYLNAKGFTQRSGGPFRLQTLHLILTRSAYRGIYYFNRRDSRTLRPKARKDWIALDVPRIVEDDVFDAVQAQLKARQPLNTPPRITTSNVLLSGVARCGCCGAPLRSRTGKGGKYWYYVCSRKADIGRSECPGVAIPMRKLDDLVTEAVCERVLAPARLKTMLSTLLARNARHQARQRAELRELHARRRETDKQIAHLVDAIETGGLDAAHAVRERLAKRQQENEALARVIALKTRTLETPIAAVGDDRLASFAEALRTRLRDQENPAFRRAYLRLMLDKVVVGGAAIKISGPKAALAHQIAADNPLPPSLVPTFVQDWRARRDSNS